MEAFIETGGMAKTLGINTNELSASLGILANAGYKGSESGRALQTVLTRLAKPPKEAANSLDALGISVFDNVVLPVIIWAVCVTASFLVFRFYRKDMLKN